MDQGSQNIAKVGLQDGDNVIIRQSWLNQIGPIFMALILLCVTSYLSIIFPEHTTLPMGDGRWSLPLLNFIPLAIALRSAFVVYNERFVITPEYLIDVEGRLAWRGRSIRVEYHRIQEIRIEETILQRIFNLGDVTVVPLAGADGIPICLRGIKHPRLVKDLIRQRKKEKEVL
jgi:uncharacterized membrane protein YdbT with pleckstrin-like domain